MIGDFPLIPLILLSKLIDGFGENGGGRVCTANRGGSYFPTRVIFREKRVHLSL